MILYDSPRIEMLNMDCMDYLKDCRDKQFELCWYDPPYNVGKKYGNGYDDDKPDEIYLEWMDRVIDETKRVSRAMCVFVPTKYGLWFWNHLGPDYKQIILSWSPEGTFRGGFVNQFSFLLTNAKPAIYTKNVWHNCQRSGLGYFFREENYGHPGYTSEDITARVIHHFSKEGDSILDPFSGTATTAVCGHRLGRNVTSIEQGPEWIEIGVKRFKQYQSQGVLF